MKYIIMKAQEARKFEDLGGLTITKQFKPSPTYIEGAVLEQTDGGSWRIVDDTGRHIGQDDGAADAYVPPVQPGDVVYIREPWIRLKNPDGSPSDRIRLAADSVVSEGQEAEASNLPVGEGSDYDTYDGDMSKEDYERIAAAIDIDAERERLTEVQDRIIWLAASRHGIEVELKTGTANEEERKKLFDARMPLAEEQKERIDEEAEIRRALEDVGVQVLTTEERAKERLEAIRARRAEISEADQKTWVSWKSILQKQPTGVIIKEWGSRN